MSLRDLLRRGPADVATLHLRNDAAGLVRALGDPSPEIVKDAAEAMSSISRQGDTPARTQLAASGPDLLRAYQRLATEISRTPPTDVIGRTDRAFAQWALVDAMGALGVPEAASFLHALVADPGADVYLRARAAAALGHFPANGNVALLEGLLAPANASRTLVEGAIAGLLALGSGGIAAVREAALDASRPEVQAATKRALDHERAVQGPAAAVALAILNEEAGARREAERIAAEAREAAQRAAEAERLVAFPAAAKLARLLGHPEWVAGPHLLTPHWADDYRAGLQALRSLGLTVAEHENVLDDEMAEVWAEVQFEGERFVVHGGRQVREVLY